METFTLSKPFKTQSDQTLTEFSLDFDALTTGDFKQVRKLEAMINDAMNVELKSFVGGVTLSDSFRIATGFLAAVKGTKGLCIDDFLNLPMKDSAKLGQVSAFFWVDVD